MTAQKKNSRHQGSKVYKESNSTIPVKKSSPKNPKPHSRNAILKGFSNLLRKAFSGHKSDLLGLALFVLGLLSTLGLYFDLAGVVGKVLGPWVFLSTLGEVGYVAPFLLIIGGLSLSFSSSEDKDEPDGDSTLPARIFIGGLFIFVSACGLAHFYDNAERYGISDFNELKERGGILGFLAGAPLRALFEQFGATLVLIAIGLIGLIVATGLTFREVGGKIWRSFQLSLRFVSKSVRVVLGENREDIELFREDASQPQILIDGESRVVGTPRGTESPENPQDTDGQLEIAQEGEESIPTSDRFKEETGGIKQKYKKTNAVESAEQLEIELGPGAKGSPWKLPSPKLLERSTSRDINEALVEERGRVLERALATHGVETRLVGMVVGPTVTRYELELAPGVKL
jgi:S-DNA-T family DNA segregation ATPase FtsK/SpoIIIE